MKLTMKEEAALVEMEAHLSAAFDPTLAPLFRLNRLAHLQRLVEQVRQGPVADRLVAAARKEGKSWAEIGNAIGVSKQWAHQRWRSLKGAA